MGQIRVDGSEGRVYLAFDYDETVNSALFDKLKKSTQGIRSSTNDNAREIGGTLGKGLFNFEIKSLIGTQTNKGLEIT